MAHGLASQRGSGLTMPSREGGSTHIELWLPISDAPAEPGSLEADAPQVAAAGAALLVDDEDLVRMSTADILSDLGHTVVEAASGEEALRMVRGGFRPDLLVTDHLMPGITGTNLAHAVRSECPDVQILIVSGYAESEGEPLTLPRKAHAFAIARGNIVAPATGSCCRRFAVKPSRLTRMGGCR